MAYDQIITRTGAGALIPEQVSREIIQTVPTQSLFLSLAQAMPMMTSKQVKIPVMTGNVTASFVSGDTGRKQTAEMSWENVYVTAEELAVIVPIPEAVLDDADYDIWGEVRPRVVEAFGRAIDAAVFHGTNKPSSWPEGIVPAAITAGQDVAVGANLYQSINGEQGVIAELEEKGVSVDGFVGTLPLRARLRGAVDQNGQPIFRSAYSQGAAGIMEYELNGSLIRFSDNGALNAALALLIAGNWKMARYAIRQDMTYKILDQAVISDGDGKVELNLAEQDCVALRCVMRLGWALPTPMNVISGASYYPFAVLTPETGTAIESAHYKVTKPAKSATAQDAHDAGTGYTAEIAWSPAPTGGDFDANTVFTATVTLTKATGYYFPEHFTAADVTGLPPTSDADLVTVSRTSGSEVKIIVKYKKTAA